MNADYFILEPGLNVLLHAPSQIPWQQRKVTSRPKIIMPLTGANLLELQDQIRNIPAEVDILEWRVDLLEDYQRPEQIRQAANLLARHVNKPVLGTLRSRAEGGLADISDIQYLDLLDVLVRTRLLSLLDVEITHPLAKEIFRLAKRYGLLTVGSKHFFDQYQCGKLTHREITDWYAKAHRDGADVAKLALNVPSPRLLLTFLSATEGYYYANPKKPVMAVAMGELGKIARLGGGVFGSCATFATSGAASAPGQLDLNLTAKVLDTLHSR